MNMQTQMPETDKFREWCIRKPLATDWEHVAEISNLESEEPVTGDELRRRYDTFPKNGMRFYEVAADNDDVVIGCARAIHRPGMSEGCFYCQIELDLSVRGQGLGSFLHERVNSYFQAEKAKVLTFFVRESDERSLRFAITRGYAQDRVLSESKLDLAGFDPAPFQEKYQAAVDAGLEILNLAQLGDTENTWREIHRLLCESDTAPDIELWGNPTYEEFYENTRNAQWFVPHGILVARWNGDLVGFHAAGPLPDSSGWTTDYTGIIPSARRNGFALALKLAGAKVARTAGATWIITHNDSSNEGMLSINIALGFQMQPGYAQMRKWL